MFDVLPLLHPNGNEIACSCHGPLREWRPAASFSTRPVLRRPASFSGTFCTSAMPPRTPNAFPKNPSRMAEMFVFNNVERGLEKIPKAIRESAKDVWNNPNKNQSQAWRVLKESFSLTTGFAHVMSVMIEINNKFVVIGQVMRILLLWRPAMDGGCVGACGCRRWGERRFRHLRRCMKSTSMRSSWISWTVSFSVLLSRNSSAVLEDSWGIFEDSGQLFQWNLLWSMQKTWR